jgi:group I intron endonuclease
MAVVYKATNTVNGKSYIGFDVKWPHRQARHKHDAFKRKSDYAFHQAIRKHGWDSFKWEILKEDAKLEDEIRLIKEHDTYINGYNETKGGEGTVGRHHSQETRNKIRAKSIGNKNCVGRVLSEETKAKIRAKRALQKNTTKGRPSPLRGRKQPKELVEKRIAARMATVHKQRVTQGF